MSTLQLAQVLSCQTELSSILAVKARDGIDTGCSTTWILNQGMSGDDKRLLSEHLRGTYKLTPLLFCIMEYSPECIDAVFRSPSLARVVGD